MQKTFTIHETSVIPDTTKPGIYWDPNINTLYIVAPSGVYTSWVDFNFNELWDPVPSDDIVPYEPPTAEQVPEIRGLCANDLKEMLAMAHEAAAVALVQRP